MPTFINLLPIGKERVFAGKPIRGFPACLINSISVQRKCSCPAKPGGPGSVPARFDNPPFRQSPLFWETCREYWAPRATWSQAGSISCRKPRLACWDWIWLIGLAGSPFLLSADYTSKTPCAFSRRGFIPEFWCGAPGHLSGRPGNPWRRHKTALSLRGCPFSAPAWPIHSSGRLFR